MNTSPQIDLIFSTALGVYVFDCSGRPPRQVRGLGPPEFYGISAGPYGVVVSNSCIDNAGLQDHDAYRSTGMGHLSFVEPQSIHSTASVLLQPHQIECYNDHVICANSGRNCITVFGPSSTVVHHYPTLARYDVLPDGSKGNHFNSIHVRNGVVHVVAHNHDRFSAVWLFTWPNFELIDVIGTQARWAHNVMLDGGDLLLCNSKAGSVYSVGEQRNLWTLEGGGFITRGLAATERYLFVGLTAIASKRDRKSCNAAICVLDRQTMRLLDRYDFAEIGGIHELRLLDIHDECHSGAIIRSSCLSTEVAHWTPLSDENSRTRQMEPSSL